MKDLLFKLRYEIEFYDKSEKWSLENLSKVCSSLKNNKARDSDGLVYELFKPSKCGPDTLISILHMFNSIKSTLNIPEFMKEMYITSIYKSKGQRNLLKNERGLFNLSKVRSLLDKMLYNEVYENIDKNLSCSNAGGRKGRGSRDQLFILNSIINDVINGKSKSCDLQSWDVAQCFDKMNYCETNNDLWDASE